MLFGRHAREFRRAFARREWERTAEGIHFPKQHALLRGMVTLESKHGVRRFPNIVITSQMPYLFAPGGMAAALDGLYITLFGGNVTTNQAWEALYVDGDAQTGPTEYILYASMLELGSAPEGYDESTRPAWTWAVGGAGLIDNSASPAAFTMRTTSTIDVYGAALSYFDQKRYGKPIDTFSGSGGNTQLDLTNCFFPEVNPVNGYLPVGAVDNGAHPSEIERYGYGRSISIDPAAHGGDPNQCPKASADNSDVIFWHDPSGDDYYDEGLGHWLDPSGDSFAPYPQYDTIFAASRFSSAPLTFSNLDPLNITWGIELAPT